MAVKERKVNKKKGIAWRLVVFPLIMLYMEYYFRLQIYDNVMEGGVYPFVFAVAAGSLIAMATCVFRNIGNQITAYVCVAVITILYISQILYHDIFGTFYGFSSLKAAGDAMDFSREAVAAIKANIGCIAGMVLPLVCLILCSVVLLSYERPDGKKLLIGGGVTFVFLAGSVFSLNIAGKEMLSPYYLFHENFIMNLSMKRLGVVVTMERDIQVKIKGGGGVPKQSFNEKYITIQDLDADGYEPQIDASLDLKAIYQEASDTEIKAITSYVSNRKPTYKNQYSGIYEGYNLIFVNAESLSPYVVREDWMPVLYKMMHEGFVFQNYYQPTWNKSTIDGEYTNCLSQYPCPNKWSLYDSSSTYQPYALGNALSAKGYTCKAYHDYDFQYYDRSKTHPNMGYDFKAIGSGLELPSENEYFSDLEMMQTVYKEFTASEPFHAYFMTYSGHLPYTYEDNPIAEKNREEAERLTAGLPYNDSVRAYVAAQLEFEYALEYLVDQLEKDGMLDHTLFVISPDHFPYEFRTGNYDVLAQKPVLDSSFTTYRSCLAIWNSKMETSIEIDKICAGVDILPTVLNLMGIAYDSRLLAGRDILYQEEGYAVFEDYSYITPYVECDGERGSVEPRKKGETMEQMQSVMDLNKIEQMFKYSDKMIEKNYFGYIYRKHGKN